MDKYEAYIQRCETKLAEYLDEVTQQKRPVGNYERLAVERYLKDLQREDLEFRKDKFHQTLKFCSLLKINVDNRFTQFNPSGWQIFLLANLYGFYWRGTEFRRFRYGVLSTARKMGKTTTSALLTLLHTTILSEKQGEAYMLATTKKQAALGLRTAKEIRRNSPVIRNSVVERQYHLEYRNKEDSSIAMVHSSEIEPLNGTNPHFALIDEIASHQTDELFTTLKSGVVARKNPLILLVGTVTEHKDFFYYEYEQMCIKVLKGEAVDDSLFVLIFRPDEGDDLHDEANWLKANPNLGVTVSLQALKIEYQQALNSPNQLNAFFCKNLNVWIDSPEMWIEDEYIRAAFTEEDLPDDAIGYIGMDLSQTRDLTAVLALFYSPKQQRFYTLPKFFFPKNESRKLRQSGVDLQRWIDAGYIKEQKKKIVDYDDIISYIELLLSTYNIVGLAYDRWNAQYIIDQLNPALNVFEFPQNAKTFNFPLRYLEKMIFEEKITLSRNPVLRWMFRNVRLYSDGNANIKIAKNKSEDAVDGVVALTMAMGLYIHTEFSDEAKEAKMLEALTKPLAH